MALTEEGGSMGTTMLVSPATIGGGAGVPYPVYMGGGGFGQQGGGGFGNGGDWGWVVLLILLIAIGGWGNNGNGNSGGGFGGGQPIIVNDGNGNGYAVQRGFDQAAVMSGLQGIQSGVQSLSTQLCNCCADMAQTVNSGFANAETAANARQIADMQQAFAAQTATAQGFNSIQSQLAQCLNAVGTLAA